VHVPYTPHVPRGAASTTLPAISRATTAAANERFVESTTAGPSATPLRRPCRIAKIGSVRRAAANEGSDGRRKARPVVGTPPLQRPTSSAPLGPSCVGCGAQLWAASTSLLSGLLGQRTTRGRPHRFFSCEGAARRCRWSGERSRAIKAGKARARDERARAAGFASDAWERELEAATRTRSLRDLRAALAVSTSQASRFRSGAQVPHPKHWPALASLVVAQSSDDRPMSGAESDGVSI
jgi:hypothetical protein